MDTCDVAIIARSAVRGRRSKMATIDGTNDQVVARAEADQVVERLRALGKPVNYLLLEGEGHGLSTLDHQLQALSKAAQWLKRYLKDN